MAPRARLSATAGKLRTSRSTSRSGVSSATRGAEPPTGSNRHGAPSASENRHQPSPPPDPARRTIRGSRCQRRGGPDITYVDRVVPRLGQGREELGRQERIESSPLMAFDRITDRVGRFDTVGSLNAAPRPAGGWNRPDSQIGAKGRSRCPGNRGKVQAQVSCVDVEHGEEGAQLVGGGPVGYGIGLPSRAVTSNTLVLWPLLTPMGAFLNNLDTGDTELPWVSVAGFADVSLIMG